MGLEVVHCASMMTKCATVESSTVESLLRTPLNQENLLVEVPLPPGASGGEGGGGDGEDLDLTGGEHSHHGAQKALGNGHGLWIGARGAHVLH